MKTIIVIALLLTAPAFARDLGLGPAGLLAGSNKEELEPITLSAGKPLTDAPYMLTSGTYYELTIIADGTTAQKLTGGDFFRAVWVDSIETESGSIMPTGLNGIAMEDEGEMTIGFIAILPGRYVLEIPGARGDTQRAIFNIVGK
ncbi:hypothetical protein [Profundibacter amoris]|uniref:Uncharacterized protein n=1 Tax=Profundibacter amoris TaxID=2171755 RepID=A0A347UCW3_9RHOB|nr:hypothetical protein [Profundibacter amoris]AXX96691.1 hypothetical protein BAR1_01300 [Profundibacter amoris]